jgi:hypothetical protein
MRSKRHTDPTPDPVPAELMAGSTIDNAADVPADVPADTLIGIIPADVPAADVPTVPAWITAFHATFPDHVGSVPAWIDPMCGAINAAWNGIPADTDRNAITFDGWITRLHAADPTERPARGHRYTMGSGSDIARTQNAIYVAFMLAGIPWKRIPSNFGAALWRFVLGETKCDYRVRAVGSAGHFVTTFGRFVAHDHNDTTGIDNADAENAARAWRDAKPATDNSAAS